MTTLEDVLSKCKNEQQKAVVESFGSFMNNLFDMINREREEGTHNAETKTTISDRGGDANNGAGNS